MKFVFAASLFFSSTLFAGSVFWEGEKGISKIFTARCMACHSPAVKDKPAIVIYDVAVTKCPNILNRVWTKKDMPAFNNATRMTEEERAVVAEWVNAGAPKSETNSAPNPACVK